MAGLMPPGLFLLLRRQDRSSNTHFFFGGHLPQTFGFCSAKQILLASFATPVRAGILSGRNIFCTLGEEQQRQGLMPLGLFLFHYYYYPAVRTGYNNTHFFSVVIFLGGGHLPQTSGFRSAKEILVMSFATQPRAFILSDRNIFYTPPGWGGGNNGGV